MCSDPRSAPAVTKINKAEAQAEVLRRWRALPPSKRLSVDDALALAAELAQTIDFPTLGQPAKIIRSWLIQDLVGFSEPIDSVALKR